MRDADVELVAAELRTSAQITSRNVRRSLQSQTFAAATYLAHFLTTLHLKHDCGPLYCSTTVPHLSCLCNLLFFLLPLHTSPTLNLHFPYTIYSIGSVSVCAKICPPPALLCVFKFPCRDKFVFSSFTKPFRLLEKLPAGFRLSFLLHHPHL